MSNLVIVAIPDEDDRVWKISSEKVPHLTLLFLGDVDKVKNLQSIVQFVEHAANMSLRRFFLPIDHRGELGADSADVLFFKKGRYDYKAVRDFRMQLLMDNNIRTAYDSATQFEGPWTPHLTLGYPAAPAKPDPDDYKLYDVQFTKIAVWTGDFDGPEFELKDPWDEWETAEVSPMDIAMSDLSDVSLEDLEHHGVKGMRWGVRKAGRGGLAVAKAADNTAFALGTHNRYVIQGVVADAHKTMKKQDLPDIKAKHGAAGKKLNRMKDPLSSEAKAYRKDVKAAYLQRLEQSANSRKNFQGNRRYTLTENGKPNTNKYLWRLKTQKIEHADAEIGDFEFEVHPVFDDDGWITDFEMAGELAQSDPEDDALTMNVEEGAEFLVHSGLMTPEQFLEDYGIVHYGVKGMRWGQRRARDVPAAPPSAVAPSATSRVPGGAKRKTKIKVEGGENHDAHPDALKVAEAKAKLKKSGPAALSNSELQEVAKRMQLEGQVKQLVAPAGKKFVTNFLRQQGQQQAQQVVQQQVKKQFSK